MREIFRLLIEKWSLIKKQPQYTIIPVSKTESIRTSGINILRHSRRFFRCACKALLPAAP
ncbi:hypothetical protein CCO49_00005 [Salmonella enterica subsp. arizonae serovar 47:z4,z23:-]|nr:hypothetical protein CCO49_00005 [Salmonella enterica subsp. arizonae serovar 47:z4,z23:-]